MKLKKILLGLAYMSVTATQFADWYKSRASNVMPTPPHAPWMPTFTPPSPTACTACHSTKWWKS